MHPDIPALVSVFLGTPDPDALPSLISRGFVKQVIIDPPRYILTREGNAYLRNFRDATEMGIVSIVNALVGEIPK